MSSPLSTRSLAGKRETVADIQRWDFFAEVGINEPVRYLHLEAVKGRYVTYADHVAAVAAAEQRVRDEFMDSTPELTAYRKQQYAAGVKVARDAVDGIEHWASYSPDGDVWACFASDPLAAIDGVQP